jgi:glycosyltransferase involved in cell wall biosynthesis
VRILHLNFHRGWGGQPQRILMESRELARRGHAVALAVPGDGILADRAREAGLTVFGDFRFRPPAELPSFVRDVRELRRVVRDWKPSILHSHGSQDTWVTLVANRWPGGARLPHVLTRHNTKRVSDTLANRFLYRRIDRLVVVSASVLDRYGTFIRRGIVHPDSVPVIASSIEIDRFRGPSDPQRLRRELGLPDDAVVAGCVGRLVPDKGQRHLIEAAALLRERHPALHLVLAGTGTDEAALRALTTERGLEGHVHFLGFRTDIPEVTAAFDIAVLPSVDCDASSAVIKEAMALGRPVIATDIGGAREMLDPGPSGLLVPPRDASALAGALDALLRDPERAARLGATGPALVAERFSPTRLAEDSLALYTAVLESAKAR